MGEHSDTCLQLGMFVFLLNSYNQVSIQASGEYVDKLNNIARHLEKQGNTIKAYEDQSVNPKNKENYDVEIREITKGKNLDEIVGICREMIIDNPDLKKHLLMVIDRLNND